MKTRFIFILLFVCISKLCWGQDFAFSNFQLLNPATTGQMHQGQARLMGVFRNQWDSPGAPNAYTGAGLAFDLRSCSKRAYFWAGGITIQHDVAGLATWQNTRGAINIAVHRRLSADVGAAVGFSGGLLNFGFRDKGLLFDEQFNGTTGTFDPTADNGELFGPTFKLQADFSAGFVCYSLDRPGTRRSNIWNVGLAFHHINQPNYSLLGNTDQHLGIGLSLHASAETRVGDNNQSGIGYRILFRKQSFNWSKGNQPVNPQWNSLQWQGLVGLSYRLFFDNQSDTRVSTGLALRTAGRHSGVLVDAIIPSISVGGQQWGFNLSYDANLTGLPDRFPGGLELSFLRTFGEAEACVHCPRF